MKTVKFHVASRLDEDGRISHDQPTDEDGRMLTVQPKAI
jgi:hypothetical protein